MKTHHPLKQTLFVAFFCLLQTTTHAQSVGILKLNKAVGAEFYDANGKAVKSIPPIYEELAIYTSLQVGGMQIGADYKSTRNWNDTEFIETPIDPNDLSLTRVDTNVVDKFSWNQNILIKAKLGGKWGLIDEGGKEVHPFEFNEILNMRNQNWAFLPMEYYPLLLCYKGSKNILVNARGETVIAEAQFPVWYQNLNNQRKGDALEFAFFGKYLLLCEGGILKDAQLPAGGSKVTVYQFVGGLFNVLDLTTNTPLWEKPAKDLDILFLDPDGKPYFESFNPRSNKSISKFEENNRLGITPAQVIFTPKY